MWNIAAIVGIEARLRTSGILRRLCSFASTAVVSFLWGEFQHVSLLVGSFVVVQESSLFAMMSNLDFFTLALRAEVQRLVLHLFFRS